MAAVRSVDTTPEMIVRRILYRIGCRYRLHLRSLPGSPDIVFPGRRKVVFVHGCFWHRHSCKNGRSLPKTHKDYWLPKFARNRKRDRANRAELKKLGWDVLIVWECWTRKPDSLATKLARFVGR